MAIKLGNLETGIRVTGFAERGGVMVPFDVAAWGVVAASDIATEEMRPYRIAPLAGAVQSVEVAAQPEHGRGVVNDDLGVIVVPPRGATGADSLTLRTVYSDGTPDDVTTYNVAIAQSQTRGGFNLGLSAPFYKRAADGSFLFELDDSSIVIYASSSTGKTVADIAAERGLSPADIDSDWMENNHQTFGYGLSEAQALNEDAFGLLWISLTYFGHTSGRKSPRALLKAGDTFSDESTFADVNGNPAIFPNGARGLHARRPILWSRYGVGADPVVNYRLDTVSGESQWIAIQKVTINGGSAISGGYGAIFDSLNTHGELNAAHWGAYMFNRIRYENCVKAVPADGVNWTRNVNDSNVGTFMNNSWVSQPVGNKNGYGYLSGIGFNECLFETVNFDPGYDPDLTTFPETTKPPTSRGHGIYGHSSASDVTLKNTIMSRIGLTGFNNRGGAATINTVFMSCNTAIIAYEGDYTTFDGLGDAEPDANGHTDVVFGTVITEAGGWATALENAKTVAGYEGREVQGSSLVDVVIMHAAPSGDVARAAELASQGEIQGLSSNPDSAGVGNYLTVEDFHALDVVVYNWNPANDNHAYNADRNVAGLDTAALDATDVFTWADAVRGVSGSTMSDVGALLQDSADPINDYLGSLLGHFLPVAGFSHPTRTAPTTMKFIPDTRTEGRRWDIASNWLNHDVPGGMPGRWISGDSVDLAGYDTIFTQSSTDIADLDLGEGELTVASGWLGITGATTNTGGSVKCGFTGWLEINDCADALTVHVEGLGEKRLFNETRALETREPIQGHARFGVTGTVSALALTVDWGEAVIKEGAAATTTALTMTRRGGEEISTRKHTEEGMGGSVLFDGQAGGVASLTLGGTTTIVADDAALPTISKGRSGEYAGPANVSASLTLGGDLVIDLNGHLGDMNQTLFSADVVSGAFSGVTALGLGSRDLTLTVGASAVGVSVAAGTGQITVA